MVLDKARATFESWEQAHGRPVWSEDDVIVVGVSGGPDSLALLHLLDSSWAPGPKQIVAAHLNHGLREAADREAEFVAQECSARGLPYRVERVDVAGLAREEGQSLEEAGRTARYRFLAKVARQHGAHCVAVGHTADDQAETVLMHFVRGTGLAGLRGMLPVTGLPDAPEYLLVRPLLSVTRREVERYCREHELSPLYDPSNEDLSFFRNRLRHELLPLLEQYNPQIKERLRHTATVVAADYELLQTLRREAWEDVLMASGDDWLRVDLQAWRALPLSLRRSTLRHAVWALRSSLRDVAFKPIELARRVADQGEVGAQASLPGGLELVLEYEAWILKAAGAVPPHYLPQIDAVDPIPLSVPGRLELSHGWNLRVEAEEDVAPADVANGDPWLVYIDARAAGDLVVRNRMTGERFQPLGMPDHSTKVSDFMINEKLPAHLRAKWPIVANREQLVWLVGYRIDERVKVRASTGGALRLQCTRAL
jgi:tRNA(Ile)-lysidine synthase